MTEADLEEALGRGDVEQRLLDIAFLDGQSPEDRAVLAGLPAPRRVATMRRLLAMLLGDTVEEKRPEFLTRILGQGGAPGRLADPAAAAGVGRSVFFELRRKWRKRSRLVDLVPYPPGTGRGTKAFPEVEAVVRRELAKQPDATTETIARAVIADPVFGSPPARQTVRRIVEAERERSRTDAVHLNEAFGSGYVVDYLPIELAIAPAAGDPEWAGLALVMEAASGLAVGWKLGFQGDAVDAVDAALAVAAAEVARIGPRLRAGVSPTMAVSMPPEADFFRWARLRESLAESGNAMVRDRGVRRLGREAIPLLGKRIGMFRLRPRKRAGEGSRLTGQERATQPVYRLDEAANAVGIELKERNASILRRLRELDLVGHHDDGVRAVQEMLAPAPTS